MSYSDDIDRAVVAHRAWRARLLSAIEHGTGEITVEEAQADDLCELGAWFHSLPASLRETDQARSVHTLHAEFHAEAARVLRLALEGRAEEASRALAAGGRYSGLSAGLAIGLSAWQRSLSRPRARRERAAAADRTK